jgi:hypothetical protein
MTERKNPMTTDTATDAYSSFTVTDLESARTFYRDVLGLHVEDRDAMLTIHLPGGASTVAYASRNHEPARFTILNIVVPDLPSTVADLTRRGVDFERYEGVQIDSDGIHRQRPLVRLGSPTLQQRSCRLRTRPSDGRREAYRLIDGECHVGRSHWAFTQTAKAAISS